MVGAPRTLEGWCPWMGWRGRGDESGLVSRLRHSPSLSLSLTTNPRDPERVWPFRLSRISPVPPLFCARFLRGTDDDARPDAFTNHRLFFFFFLLTINGGKGVGWVLPCRRHSEGRVIFLFRCVFRGVVTFCHFEEGIYGGYLISRVIIMSREEMFFFLFFFFFLSIV